MSSRVTGELRLSRSRCRNCGRPMTSRPGQGILTFCSLACFERYPLDACASMATRDLVRIVSRRRPKSITDTIETRSDLEREAVAVLRDDPETMVNLNPDGFVPAWIATRRGADRARYDAERVEPEGPAPRMALAAERAYILARGGGVDMRRLMGQAAGYASLPADCAAAMASAIIRELPAEARRELTAMLGQAGGTNAMARIQARGRHT